MEMSDVKKYLMLPSLSAYRQDFVAQRAGVLHLCSARWSCGQPKGLGTSGFTRSAGNPLPLWSANELTWCSVRGVQQPHSLLQSKLKVRGALNEVIYCRPSSLNRRLLILMFSFCLRLFTSHVCLYSQGHVGPSLAGGSATTKVNPCKHTSTKLIDVCRVSSSLPGNKNTTACQIQLLHAHTHTHTHTHTHMLYIWRHTNCELMNKSPPFLIKYSMSLFL